MKNSIVPTTSLLAIAMLSCVTGQSGSENEEACAKHEEKTWLQGSLRLTRWDDALVVGEYKDKIVSITPEELLELHNVFYNDYYGCDERFPNVAYALYRTGQKPSRTARQTETAPAETENSLKCQFATE